MTGALLPAEAVRAARAKDIESLNSFPVYRKVPRGGTKGKLFIKVRWVDINKGDSERIEIRSRLVAREFRWKNPFLEVGFAATPPLEAFYLLLSWTMTVRRRNGRRIVIIFRVLDVSRAHFHAF